MPARSNKPWLAVLVAGLLVFPLLVTSCAKEPDDPASLEGYWLSGGAYPDAFEVSGKNFTQYEDDKKTVLFSGTIANDPDLTAESGTIIVKLADDGKYHSMTAGYFFGFHWQNLSDSGVSAAYAYKSPYTNPANSGVATLTEAQAEYTVANEYFGKHGDYERK